MKKALVLALVAILAVSVLAVAGCGEVDKAKEYMKEGDDLSIKLEDYTKQATESVTDLLIDLGVDLTVTGDVDFDRVVEEADKQIGELVSSGEKAKAEYQKILDLDGVEDYKEYANYRIKAIDNTTSLLEKMKSLIDTLNAAAKEGKDLSEVAKEWSQENASALKDAVKAAAYWIDAEKVKKEKNL